MTDTAHRWRENDLDNELLTELAYRNPSEERLRQLVSQGANLNSLDEFDESVLMKAIGFLQDGLPIRFIHLLVELGADVNYQTEDGACALSGATISHSPEVVKFLLEKGANPNVIIEYRETILDDAEFDYWYHKDEIMGRELDPFWAEKMGEIVEILKRFGAKNLDDLRASEVSRWLKIFAANSETGLITSGGYIEIDSIKKLPDELRTDFKKWLESHWDSYPDKSYKDKPEGFDREKHNQWGQRLAREVKTYLPPDIKVRLLTINAEDEQKFRRNVNEEVID
jgi:hypothetical protein